MEQVNDRGGGMQLSTCDKHECVWPAGSSRKKFEKGTL